MASRIVVENDTAPRLANNGPVAHDNSTIGLISVFDRQPSHIKSPVNKGGGIACRWLGDRILSMDRR
jgi:hypothetical protein